MSGARTVAAALADGRRRLREAGIETALLDAELLLGAAARMTRETLLLAGPEPVPPDALAAYAKMIGRRVGREPLARILGEREFRSLSFRLNAETLVPRPDSETLVEAALGRLAPVEHPWRLLDLGAGSGCLLLALLHALPAATGVGTDISAEALTAARANAARLGLEPRAEFRQADWTDGLEENGFDMVLSNPPYIPSADIDSLMPEVARFEPRRALDGGLDGLDAYRRIAAKTDRMLRPGGRLLLEVGEGQSGAVGTILESAGYRVEETRPDLAGIDRVIVTSLAEDALTQAGRDGSGLAGVARDR